MTTSTSTSPAEVAPVTTLLELADDALIAAQRLAQWWARGPQMEEDVALMNIALDQLGAARLLLSYAGEVEGAGRDEDDLAFQRDESQFHHALLVELPERDFAVTIAKLLFLSTYQHLRYQQLATGADQRLAEIAAKTVKESAYHVEHAARWTLRLGDGTPISHRRMQAAVDEVWPYTHELFASTHELSAGDGPQLHGVWLPRVQAVLDQATLDRPADNWRPEGGRAGRHTEALGFLLAEMQVLHRAHPGARW